MQADEDEDQAVEAEGDDVGDRIADEPGARAQHFGGMPAAEQPRREHRHDPGSVDGIGGQIGGEGQDDAPDRLEIGVAQQAVDEFEQRGDDEPDQRAPRRDEQELHHRRRDREAPGRDRLHREGEQHERGRVVDDALAFDQRHHPARRAEPAHDRDRRGRVGRGENGAQGHRRAERQARDQPMREQADRGHGRHDEADRQDEDRAQALAEFAPGQMQRRLVEDRRQQHGEDDFGRDADLRQAGRQRERGAAEHQRDRVGQPEPARDPGERRAAHHERDDDMDRQHERTPRPPAPAVVRRVRRF